MQTLLENAKCVAQEVQKLGAEDLSKKEMGLKQMLFMNLIKSLPHSHSEMFLLLLAEISAQSMTDRLFNW